MPRRLHYSKEQRRAIVAEREIKNWSVSRICRKYGIGESTYYKIRKENIDLILENRAEKLEKILTSPPDESTNNVSIVEPNEPVYFSPYNGNFTSEEAHKIDELKKEVATWREMFLQVSYENQLLKTQLKEK